jgi:hypothetical protein
LRSCDRGDRSNSSEESPHDYRPNRQSARDIFNHVIEKGSGTSANHNNDGVLRLGLSNNLQQKQNSIPSLRARFISHARSGRFKPAKRTQSEFSMLRFGIVESNSVACREDLASSSLNFGTYDSKSSGVRQTVFLASLGFPTPWRPSTMKHEGKTKI